LIFGARRRKDGRVNRLAHRLAGTPRVWPAALAICAAALAAYRNSFSAPLLYDDRSSIAANPTIRHLSTALSPSAGATVGGRPILNLSFAINYAVSGASVWSYHALNLAIHVFAGLAIFGIVRRTLAPRNPAALLIAFSAALLWTLHPLQTESVTYIVQRAESLMGLFYLLTLYCFIRGAGAAGNQARAWYAASIAACFLGMGTKEVMVSAPLIVLLYDRTFLAGSFSEAWRSRAKVYAGLAATWLVLPILVLSTHGRAGTAGFASGAPVSGYALAQFSAIVHYLRLSFWPHPLVFDYGIALAPRFFQLIPCALAIIGLVAATAWALVERPVLGFLGACFFAILAPSSSIVPIATETMAEHRMYLPLIPLVVLVVLEVYRRLGRAALPICLVLAAGLGLATARRNQDYSSEVAIWSDTVAKVPDNYRAHMSLGAALADLPSRLPDAIAEFGAALRIHPDYAEGHYNLGVAYAGLPGRLPDAIAEFDAALKINPGYAEAHNDLGEAYARSPGRLPDAIAQFQAALQINPDDAKAHYNLGLACSGVPGRLPDAIAQFEAALTIDPDFAEAHFNLGVALLKAGGRNQDARAQFDAALRLRPDWEPRVARFRLDQP
jgi:tetratricopeptide (TPR) repeat protein